MRGDVPFSPRVARTPPKFSPRARGCSRRTWSEHILRGVFPACAGMFPPGCGELRCTRCFPRVRGDVPPAGPAAVRAPRFSPRARGCSSSRGPGQGRNSVFPACAGMFLNIRSQDSDFACFPRVRGDVPVNAQCGGVFAVFSPRARGCSEAAQGLSEPFDVFPACAGMFLRSSRKSQRLARFPRVRGDVPAV